MSLFDRIKAKVTNRRQVERSRRALSQFETTIKSWDREQARIALAVLATGYGDQGPLESIFGKGATAQTAIRRLTVGNIKVLASTMEEIFPGFASGEDEEYD